MTEALSPSPRVTRVALVTVEYPPTVGGVATSAARLVRTLTANGYEVHVIVPVFVGTGDIVHRSQEGCPVYEVPIHVSDGLHRGSLSFLQRIKRLDRALRFDFFHSFFLFTAFPCALVAGNQRPLLVSLRGGDMATQYHSGIVSGAVHSLGRANWVTSVNQHALNQVRRLVNLEGRCSVLRNGVAACDPSQHWRLARAKRGGVGMVGQFSRVKDVPLLMRAFSALRANRPKPQLHLFGRFLDPKEEAWSRTLAREFNSAERVTYHGEQPRDALLGQVSQLHVYVQCSASEGLPNALLEAAAAGVPLVATHVEGMAEVLTDGENALLVPHGDPAALAAAIDRLLGDDALAEQLSHGARRLAASLSIGREQDAWLELYRRLGDRQPRPMTADSA